MNLKALLAIISLPILLASCIATAGEPDTWSRFRGPNGSGVIGSGGLPVHFGPDQNVVWKTNLPAGHSSPVLSESRIYLTGFEGDDLFTIGLDRSSGKEIWRKVAPRNREEKLDARNSPAAASPALDESENVYVFFGDLGLISYDRDGKERWSFPLGPFNNAYGMGASPMIAGDVVVMVCDQQQGSFIVAIDKESGELRWRQERPEATSGHSSPILYDAGDEQLQILVPGSFLLTAYDANTGEKAWWVRGLAFEMKSTPVIADEMLFVNGYATPLNQPDRLITTREWAEELAAADADENGYFTQDELQGPARNFFSFVDLNLDKTLNEHEWNYYRSAMASLNGMLGIRLGGSGDMSQTAIQWQYHRSVPQLPSPLLYKNVLYMINDGGIATSFQPQDGEVLAQGRIQGAIDKYYASPVAADDKVFFVSETCKVAVLRTDGSLEAEAVNDLQSNCYATPAIAAGRVYIRTLEALYAFGITD